MRIAKKAVRKAKARKKTESRKAARKTRTGGNAVKSAEMRTQSKASLDKIPAEMKTTPWTLSESGIWLPRDSRIARPPAQLYKYAQPNLAHIEHAIIGGQVLFANPLRFNDPFDCRMSEARWNDPKPMLRRACAVVEDAKKAGFRSDLPPKEGDELRQHQERMERDPEYRKNWLLESSDIVLSYLNMGVCCLSANERSIQMWAHYAGNHTGVCYKFDLSGYKLLALPGSGRGIFPFFAVLQVEYLEKFPPRESGEFVPEGFPAEFSEKHREWGYEKEWRALMPDSNVSWGGMMRLPPEWSACQGAGFYHHRGILDGVILGCRAAADFEKKVIDMADFRGMGVWKAKPKIDEYDFDILPHNQYAKEKNNRAGD